MTGLAKELQLVQEFESDILGRAKAAIKSNGGMDADQVMDAIGISPRNPTYGESIVSKASTSIVKEMADEAGRAGAALGDKPDAGRLSKLVDHTAGAQGDRTDIPGTSAGADAGPDRQVALPGTDGERAEALLDSSKRLGVATLGTLAHAAVTRLLSGDPAKARRLFNDSERKQLAAALAATTGTAELLGRARIRLRLAQARKHYGHTEKFHDGPFGETRSGVRLRALAMDGRSDLDLQKGTLEKETAVADPSHTSFSDLPTDFSCFDEPANKPHPLAPEKALTFFQRLVPGLMSRKDAGPLFERNIRKLSFDLAVTTDDELLGRVQDAIAKRLETGEKIGKAPVEINEILEAAGVAPNNPSYGSLIFRTATMSSYNRGNDLQRQDPDVAAFFPVWRYAGIADGRERHTFEDGNHRSFFGKYYDNSVNFDEVRDSIQLSPWNCRCNQIPIYKTEWAKLQQGGAAVESFREKYVSFPGPPPPGGWLQLGNPFAAKFGGEGSGVRGHTTAHDYPQAKATDPEAIKTWDSPRKDDVAPLVESMKTNGWQGRPVIAVRDGDALHGMTGSQRTEAAKIAGVKVPVIEVSAKDFHEAALKAGFKKPPLPNDKNMANADRLAIFRHLDDKTPAKIMGQETVRGGKTLDQLFPDKNATRSRVVNGATQTYPVEKSETHNGATVEMLTGPRGYPVIRMEKSGKEGWIVPNSGEGDLSAARSLANKNFDTIIANAKNQGLPAKHSAEHFSGGGSSDEPEKPAVKLSDPIPVPDQRQDNGWQCGAAALQSVLQSLGQTVSEDDLADELGTTREAGTPPDAILQVLRERGIQADAHHRMTLADLSEATAAGKPVLVPMQAWEDTPAELATLQAGHWVVVIGVDGEDVRLQDPAAGKRSVPLAEFLRRWRDRDAAGRLYRRFGIVVG